ncbi:SigE family RNA polymerase sigma factor [Actinoplanes sp. RD1]|uniref:SigE family RNA polymerase sigma factor n=1 Tax=Actinoplanes sp. RD1 TaxID=3064538 RepID=UPI0027409B20|nr:SigE family RNA polymerase sigma factor [Actinoplanes sp. RD1]
MRFEEFVAARLPTLARYATVLCSDRAEADDVVQEVLTRALMRWRRIGELEEPYAYVRAMVTNEFLSRRRLVPLDRHEPAAPPEPEVLRPELWARLSTLPRRQRAVLVLRYYEDLSDEQIAGVLGCRPGTVRTHASRGLAALRIAITSEGVVS